jgi:hypothetical protein
MQNLTSRRNAAAGGVVRGAPAVRLWLLGRRWRAARVWAVVAAACTVIGSVFMLWNLHHSPDTQYDEVVYSRADQAVAQDWRLTWTNRPLFVHPPLSFLIQAAWLHLRGVADQPLVDVIDSTRLFAASTSVANVVLLSMLAYRLIPSAQPRLRITLTLLTALLTASDPLLVRYGRMAMIEPLAVFSCLIVLHVAWSLRTQRASLYIPIVGLLSGLSLLTNEICVFMLLTPVVYAVIGRDRRLLRRSAAALATGIAIWSIFLVWSIQLGLFGSFVDVKTVTFQRLLGTVQNTGWNQPGVSFLDGLATQAGQYASSYLVLAIGGLALVWLVLHRGGQEHRWLLAWLITSYAFGAYTVLLGTLNEQFFVYVMPAAMVSTVLVAEAVAGRRIWSSALAGLAAGAVLFSSIASWTTFSTTRNDGLAQLNRYSDAHRACDTLNTTGDVERFQLLMPDRPMADFSTGPGALSHGVNLFALSDKDAEMRYGNSSPSLNAWVRAHGVRLVAYPSATYHGVELWQVPIGPYDATAGVEPYPDGSFVFTEGSRCGGFPVVDTATSGIGSGFSDLGGKGVAGQPLTDSWTNGDTYQVFEGVVLIDPGGDPGTTSKPIVAALEAADPAGYRAANLPPLAADDAEPAATLLRDRVLKKAYTARVAEILGPPLGKATQMADGMVRQAFAGGVLERPPGSTQVRLAPIASLAIQAGLVDPPTAAERPIAPPRLPVDTEPAQPSTVEPFFWTLAIGLVLYLAIFAMIVARRVGGSAAYEPAARWAVGTATVRLPTIQAKYGAPTLPALGRILPVRRRTLVSQVSLLILVPLSGLGVRASGVLQPQESVFPALSHAAAVIPGVVRTGQPKEADLVRVRDDYGVRAVIAVNGEDDSTFSAVEERSVAAGLQLDYLPLRVSAGEPLSPAQVTAVAAMLRRQRPSAKSAPSKILVHDLTGDGAVSLVAAVIRVLDRQSPTAATDRSTMPAAYRFAPGQQRALRQLADAVAGVAKPGNPYDALQHSDW